MKMYKCKIRGTVDSEGCFMCFNQMGEEKEFPSRVLCKTKNVVEEVQVQEDTVRVSA